VFSADTDNWRLYPGSTVTGDRRDSGFVTRTSVDAGTDARAHAVGMPFVHETLGQFVTVYQGSRTGTASAAGGTPYTSAASIRIGNRQGGSFDRAISGVVCLGVAPTLTAAERTALQTIAASLPNLFNP
jgi:hypothetical protein